jgi:hypothetical protein
MGVSPSNAKNDPKKGTSEEISDFEVLNVPFVGLEASPVGLKYSWRLILNILQLFRFKKGFFSKIFSIFVLTNLNMDPYPNQ